jgi:hypothetical protein
MAQTVGQSFNQELQVAGDPENIAIVIAQAFNGQEGFTVFRPTPTKIIVTRKYTPTVVKVVAIVGFLFVFFFSLLALLYKVSEQLVIDIYPSPSGSKVVITGVGTTEAVSLVSSSLNQTFNLRSATSVSSCQYCGGSLSADEQQCPSCGAAR